jgi:protein SCO1/2
MSAATRSLAIALALAAVLAGAYTAYRVQASRSPMPPDIDATIFSTPRPVPAFELVDHDGKPFTNARLSDRWTLAFFGFTHCPDVCPTTLHTLARAAAILEESPDTQQPAIIMISVDPERDTADKLREYVPYFDPTFVGVTGSREAIDSLTASLGVAHAKIYRDDGEYTVDHSAAIFLIGPDGSQAALFSPPHDAYGLAARYQATIAWLEQTR